MGLKPPPVTAQDRADVEQRAGLCSACQHLQVLRSRRSSFVRCGLTDVDPHFARYPPLPMMRCRGFVAAGDDESP